MELLAFSIFNGLLYGMLLFMLASGLTLIFSMMGVLNFAHASFYMLGAYAGFQVSKGLGFFPALFIAPLLVGIVGGLIERYGLRTVHKYGHVPELLFTFGITYLIEELVVLIWGRLPVAFNQPEIFKFTAFTLFSIDYPAFRIFMLLVSVGMFVGLYAWLAYSKVGLIVQAALTHPDMLRALGHDVPKIFTLVFGGGAALAALAGVLGGIYFSTQPNMAHILGTIIFVVVVVGGLGSITGALLASLIIGLLTSMASMVDRSVFGWLDVPQLDSPVLRDLMGLTLAQSAQVLPYLLMVLILIFRPKGLLGKRES
ncbi:MAG: branched-chain amino acid ABC transporter permease [Proteobacteria bacterium]|nr:branched-chain amino acid ABC transporter permease [Pseudomonadota bacterium]